jgi:hypothetical protein
MVLPGSVAKVCKQFFESLLVSFLMFREISISLDLNVNLIKNNHNFLEALFKMQQIILETVRCYDYCKNAENIFILWISKKKFVEKLIESFHNLKPNWWRKSSTTKKKTPKIKMLLPLPGL